MKVLLFSSSLRKGSLNTKLMKVISNHLKDKSGFEISIANIKELNLPVYDGDIENAGFPEGVTKLGKMISEADAIIVSSPEYNGSIAAPFKNLIDWVSRLRPTPWTRKPILLTGASPGANGAIRSFSHERMPLDTIGAYVYPQYFGLAKAHEAFNDDGSFKDEKYVQRLDEILNNFFEYAKKLN